MTVQPGQTWRALSGNRFTIRRIEDGEWCFVWWYTDERELRIHITSITTTGCVLEG